MLKTFQTPNVAAMAVKRGESLHTLRRIMHRNFASVVSWSASNEAFLSLIPMQIHAQSLYVPQKEHPLTVAVAFFVSTSVRYVFMSLTAGDADIRCTHPSGCDRERKRIEHKTYADLCPFRKNPYRL